VLRRSKQEASERAPIQRGSTRAELRAVIAERNAKLCERIRGGDADTGSFAERVNEIALIACAEAPDQPPARWYNAS